MAGASLAHKLIVGNLARALGNLLLDGPCHVLTSDMKVHVPSSDGYVYPDLSDRALRAPSGRELAAARVKARVAGR